MLVLQNGVLFVRNVWDNFPLLRHRLEICNFPKGSFIIFLLLLFLTKIDVTETLEIDLHVTHHPI